MTNASSTYSYALLQMIGKPGRHRPCNTAMQCGTTWLWHHRWPRRRPAAAPTHCSLLAARQCGPAVHVLISCCGCHKLSLTVCFAADLQVAFGRHGPLAAMGYRLWRDQNPAAQH